MLVDIDNLLNINDRMQKINAEDLEKIRWLKDGVEVEFSKEDIAEWGFTGLCNTDIIYNREFHKVDDQ